MYIMAGSDNFAVEESRANMVVQWINEYAEKNGQKFEASLGAYQIQTVRFGNFKAMSWKGDWSVARSIMKKASGKTNSKVIEAGYHESKGLLSAMLGGAEYGKVYSSGRLVGHVEFETKSGKWTIKSEQTV